MTQRAGVRRMRDSYNRGGFVRSMLLGWSAVQAVFGVVLMVIGVNVGVWYVGALGCASMVIGTLIFVEELTNGDA